MLARCIHLHVAALLFAFLLVFKTKPIERVYQMPSGITQVMPHVWHVNLNHPGSGEIMGRCCLLLCYINTHSMSERVNIRMQAKAMTASNLIICQSKSGACTRHNLIHTLMSHSTPTCKGKSWRGPKLHAPLKPINECEWVIKLDRTECCLTCSPTYHTAMHLFFVWAPQHNSNSSIPSRPESTKRQMPQSELSAP